MSSFGVFAVDRGIFDHTFFAPEPFTEREAWLWMISAAAWKTTRVRAGCKMVWLVRGQLMFSERFLAERWQWSKSTVRRFIHRLESEAMVATLSDHHSTLVIICNYEKYAFGGATPGPASDHKADHARTTKRTKEEESKNLRIKEKKEGAEAPLPRKPSKRTPALPLPEDYPFLPAHQEQAAERGFTDDREIQDHFRKFRNNYWQHPERKSANWLLGWGSWLDRQNEWLAKERRIERERANAGSYGD